MRVALSSFVEGDLDAIAAYIAIDNPLRAVTFVRQIAAKFDAIGRNPLIYRLRPEIGADARLASVGRYAILFRISDGSVRIERVAYGGRDLAGLYDSDDRTPTERS